MDNMASVFPLLAKGLPLILTVVFCSFRVVSACLCVPIISGVNLPKVVSITTASLMACLVATTLPNATGSHVMMLLAEDAFFFVFALAISEALIGFVLGFVLGLTFRATIMTANIMETALGMTVTQGQISSPLTRFYPLLIIVAFLSVGGFHSLLAALATSYKLWPSYLMANSDLTPAAMMTSIALISHVLSIAIIVALPVLITILLVDVCLLAVNRLIPSIHAFFLGVPLKVLLGLSVLAVSVWITIEEVIRVQLEVF